MTPNKIFIKFTSAEALCDPSIEGKKTITVKTYGGAHDLCYTSLTWYNARTAMPDLPGGIPRDIITRSGSHLEVQRIVKLAVKDMRSWTNLVDNLGFDTWTYCDSLL